MLRKMNGAEECISHYAHDVGHFTVAELKLYLQSKHQNLPTATFYYILNKLIAQNKIVRESRGIYSSVKNATTFCATITDRMRETFAMLHKALPFANFCLYMGTDLSRLQHNMAANNIMYIETPRDTCSSSFSILKEAGRPVYMCPGREMMYRYIDISESVIIIKPIISESPIHELDCGMCIPTLEKLLVDINADDDFFYLQGEEAFNIFRNARERFTINEAKLLRYARRRNLESPIKRYLEVTKK